MKIIFCSAYHSMYHGMNVDWETHGNISSMNLMGEPIILRNIRLLSRIVKIENVAVPEKMPFLKKLISSMTTEFEVETYDENVVSGTNIIQGLEQMSLERYSDGTEIFSINNDMALSATVHKHKPDNSYCLVPLNSIIYESENARELLLAVVRYPWEFLDVIQKIMHASIKKTIISSKASIARTSIIEDPCIIEDDVIVDDFCKIKGTCYIGKGSFIGMSSLVRNCMLEDDVKIGFNCEVAKSHFNGHDKISHQNVILDSVIGKNVWFGGFSGTANVLLDRTNIRYDLGSGRLMDIGRNHFGAVVGDNSAIGAAVIILPGRYVPNDSVVQAGTIYCQQNNAVARN